VILLLNKDCFQAYNTRVPGHEVAGVIDEVGKNVTNWNRGQRVAVGWHGGHCGHCESCRRGDFVMCKYAQVPGISYDGGYSDYMISPTVALAEIPKQLSYTEAAPMMCAGIPHTTLFETVVVHVKATSLQYSE
jgi:D-arabinose 1-dehydrogenase-like Zn-dependent alcohol dehydrogenase